MDEEDQIAQVRDNNVAFVIYDGTGYVLRRGIAPHIWDVGVQPLQPGERILSWHEPLDPKTEYYVENDKLTPCQVIEPWVSKTTVLANGTDDVRITDIPHGASVIMLTSTGNVVPTTVIEDGELNLTFTEPTKLKIFIEKRPIYAQTMVEINAV